jgi:hypothetical protein
MTSLTGEISRETIGLMKGTLGSPLDGDMLRGGIQ